MSSCAAINDEKRFVATATTKGSDVGSDQAKPLLFQDLFARERCYLALEPHFPYPNGSHKVAPALEEYTNRPPPKPRDVGSIDYVGPTRILAGDGAEGISEAAIRDSDSECMAASSAGEPRQFAAASCRRPDFPLAPSSQAGRGRSHASSPAVFSVVVIAAAIGSDRA
jgi:hypothetical protein